VEPKQHDRHIVFDYLDPQMHEEIVLLNENMPAADFLLSSSNSDDHFFFIHRINIA
jgi:hypothetical protein